MKPLQGLVIEDSCTKRYLNGRHPNANCPSGLVQPIPQILELKDVTMQQIDGEACSTDSAPESWDISTPKASSKSGNPDQS